MKNFVRIALAAALFASPIAAMAKPIVPVPCAKCVPVKPKATPSGNHTVQGVVWGIIGCAGGVVLAALVKSAVNHRELTAQEAWGCGIPALFTNQ